MDTQPSTAAPEKPRLAVTPAAGSVLERLLDQEAAAEAVAKEAADRLKGLRDQVKAALTQAHPGTELFDIAGSPHRPAKTLRWVNTVRLNTDRMKAEEPETYVRFAEFGGRWELRPARTL